jgi:TonB-dependent SusC/RagA subfamily outer membrane receptor
MTTQRRCALIGWLGIATSVGCAHANGARSPGTAAQAAGRGDSVAVGYGRQLPRHMTGAVASVVAGDGAVRPGAARIEELLERLPGVSVSRLVGGDFTVQIRGPSSIVIGSDPLWVIDGQPMPQGVPARHVLSGLNPSDVARIDVLRGAAAAVYGSRGTNGVILVTMRGTRR